MNTQRLQLLCFVVLGPKIKLIFGPNSICIKSKKSTVLFIASIGYYMTFIFHVLFIYEIVEVAWIRTFLKVIIHMQKSNKVNFIHFVKVHILISM